VSTGVKAFGTRRDWVEMHETKPVFDLNHKVEIRVFGKPNSCELASAAGVVFLLFYVYGSGACVSRDAVAGVKIRPKITRLKLGYLARTTANYCGKGSGETVAMLSGSERTPEEKSMNNAFRNGKTDPGWGSKSRVDAAFPGREFA
jgi:hypothetical protein